MTLQPSVAPDWQDDLFQRVFAEAAVGMILVSTDGDFLLANRHCSRLLGYSEAELRAMSFRDLTHPDDLAATERYLARLLSGKQTTVQVEKRYIKKDGRAIWLLVRTTVLHNPDQSPQYLLSFIHDITQQRLAEDALTASELRYRTIFETAGSAMVIYRQSTVIELCNSEFCKLCGITKMDVEGKRSWTDFIASADLPRMLSYHHIRRNQPDVPPPSYEAHVIDNQGQPHEVIINVGVVPDSDLTVASLLDIAGLKKAEEERALLAAAIDQTAEGMLLTDDEGNIIYVNPAFERLSGFGASELGGTNIRRLSGHQEGMGFPKEMWRVLTKGGVWAGRFVNTRKDGSRIEVETTVSPVKARGGEVITNYIAQQRDRTNEVQLERQLRQAQKMEAIGTLAGGVAHDFNNILASIIGFTEIVLHDYLGPGHPASELLAEVVKAGGRARDLADQILTFSRRGEQALVPVSLAAVTQEALRLLRATLPATIEIRLDVEAGGGLIMADPTQLHQVILNLCTNASHAMAPKGGVLDVGVRQGTMSGGPARADSLCQVLRVADTGAGMDQDTIERIFDPYFTTKGPGEGTGLGLALVHGIVTGLGGEVEVDSTPGEGTEFICRFPLAEGAGQAQEDVGGEAPRGDESILLVDDEPGLVHMTAEMLGNLGYRVHPFTDSRQALEAYFLAPATYDLIITDQTMPGITGLELAAAVKAMRPKCPVLICSGYAELAGAEAVAKSKLGRLLRKPMTRLELARAVRRTLDVGED